VKSSVNIEDQNTEESHPSKAKKEKIQKLLRDLNANTGDYNLEKQTKLKIKMLKT